MADTFLERIVAATRDELAACQARAPLADVRARAADAPPPRDFVAALRPAPAGPARLVAEVKRASPSKGLLVEDFDPAGQARAYAAGGAAAISVLTEPRFFLGTLEHLRAVRAAVHLPLLRKDFVLDAYQVYEARAAGADALLLICALLDDAALTSLLSLTRALGMEALVEAHDAGEARRAVACGARVVGSNARDLRSFAVTPDLMRQLRPLVPHDRVFVAESGIADATGAARARAWGADAILVGEALMRAPSPRDAAHALAGAPGGGQIVSFFSATWQPFVKICGLATAAQLRLVTDLGADAYGLVFAPQAPAHRRLTPDAARALTGERGGMGTSTMRTRGGHPGALHDARSQTPATPRAVGVFVNEQPQTIAAITAQVGLDAVQLSGDETPACCAEVARLTQRPVIKAVRPHRDADRDIVDAYALAGAIPLLDTPRAGSYGGSGASGDWALARQLAGRWPLLLAGGLTAANVAVALAATGARGVDVSSGVERDGAKDSEKIRQFIAAARKQQIA